MHKLLLLFVLLFSLPGFSQKVEFFFDFNQDTPNKVSLNRIDQWLANNKEAEITKILGYCDSVDNNKYNKDLAMRRINSMLAILKENNIKVAENVELKSFGEDFKYSLIQEENRKVEVYYKLPKNSKPIANSTDKPVQPPFGRTPGKATETEKVKATDKETEIDILEAVDFETLVVEEKSTLAAKFDKAKKGDLVRIKNINFHFNSEKVMEQSIPLLNELLQIMLNNEKLRIEIHGHICCNPNPMDTKLSYRRALVILKYLTSHGIQVNRLDYKGYGSNDPIYKLPERNEMQRAANRRVEILIVAK